MPKSQLVELFAQGLGVIEEARIEFSEGFNVITGETGAGKTLLLGALDLCLGGDASNARHAVTTDMKASALFINRDGKEVSLLRESSQGGRLRSALDNATTSAESLRMLAEELIVIHGQHDSLSLKNRSEILRLVDTSGKVDTSELQEVRSQLSEALKLREGFGGDGTNREREIEFLKFQISEIESVKIVSADELIEVLEELTRLTEIRDGQTAIMGVIQTLDSDAEEAVLTRLARAIGEIPAGETYDGARDGLRSALEQARDSIRELSAFTDSDAFDEERLGALDERAAALQNIARKYNNSLEEALHALSEFSADLERRTGEAGRIENLDGEIDQLMSKEVELSRKAKKDREYASVKLTEAVRAQLPRVALPNALLRFDVGGDDGSHAQILFTPNPGLPEGPLQSLASGGELSRVLLAISLETAHDDVVAVFDEVDAGVGGQVAQQIGDCLLELGHRQQVLAVTHLASVAAKADHHFVIEKTIINGTASTKIKKVEGEERVSEIARMLVGDSQSQESRALASQLLESRR